MSIAQPSAELNLLDKDIERTGRLDARRTVYMRRNAAAYGRSRIIPASRTIAARVAGPDVIISLPVAGQIFYSGNSDHKERWIKPPGHPRDNAHRPNHVRNAFFLQPGSFRETRSAGDFIISAWDHAFADNFGYYRLHVLMKRGDGQIADSDID